MTADSGSLRSSLSDEYLQRIIAAVADGVAIDWNEASLRAATPGDREMLQQLHLLADMAAACDDTADTGVATQTPSGPYLRAALADPAGTCGNGRFVIEEQLGRGGFGVVYKAYDRERRTHVALKSFTRPGIDSVYDFKKEFRMIADLTHPNLVSLYELFAEDGSWLIAMELVPGVDFLTYVRGGVNGPATGDGAVMNRERPSCDMARLERATTQLCHALAYVHAEGKVHCDIKPSNVLVTADGQVKLVDFGLATDISQALTDPSARIRGTPAYISPEQAGGERPTAASDWYSVGIMLLEALTGQRPFHSTVSRILFGGSQQDVAVLEVPLDGGLEELYVLCRRLVEPQPQARPSDAEVLRSISRIWPASRPSSQVRAGRSDQGPFVGRQAEIATLDEAFTASAHGPLQAVFLHGVSGMGKSVLVRHFLDGLRERQPDVVVLEGRCSERESVPYKALDGLVDQLAQHFRSRQQDELLAKLPRDCAALARLFPVLRRVDAIELTHRPSGTTEPQEVRRRAGVAFRELLALISARHPLVLVIDDLQWTDADSVALLDDLVFDEHASPLLFIGCYRSEEAAGNTALRALLTAAHASQRSGHCVTNSICVDELPAQQARELVAALADRLGADTSIDAIVEESGRSPLFIHQLVQYALTTTVPGTDTHRERVAAGAVTLDSVIRARAGSFGDSARRLLEVLALFGGPLDLSLAADVAGIGQAALGNSVALRTARLARSRITGTTEKLEVYHDRIREAIVSDLRGPDLKDLHLRLATALERTADADPEALVHHFHGAGEFQAATRYAVVAGDRASDALAFDRASRSYRFALDFGRFEDAGRAVRVKLGDALAASGRGYDAAQSYLGAAADAPNEDVVELKRRASEQLLQSGHLDQGLAVVRDVLRHAGLRLPATPRRALLSLLALRGRLMVRGLRFTEHAEKDIPADLLVGVDTCWSVTTGLAIIDHIRSAEFGARHLLLALKAGEPLRIVRALAMELAYTSISGAKSQRQNEALLAIAGPLAERVPNPEARALVILARGSAAYMQGQWMTARDLCEDARQILREQCTRVTWQIDTAQFYTLLSLFYLGDIGELSRRLPVLLKEARERDALYVETLLRTRISYLASLAADDVAGAERATRQGMARWSQQGFHNQHYYEMVATADTQLYAGREVEAWAGLMQKWRDLRRTLLLRVQPILIEALHLRARTAVAAAHGLPAGNTGRAGLVRSAEKDADELLRTGAPWARGLAHLTRAGSSTLHGDRARAIRDLETAADVFDRERMGLYRAVARRRLGELLDNSEGNALVDSANAWMEGQAILNTDGFARMLAPGDFRPAVRPGSA